MNRIIQLDTAKAICIILVVIGHYIPSNSPSWYVMLHDIIYTFHMPLFMFASGYIYIATKKEISYKSFIVKKFKRLMIPYFSTSLIIIGIKILSQGNLSVDNPVTSLSFIKMFYLPEAGYFLWFIWALWWIFMLIPLMKTPQIRSLFFLLCLIVTFIPFTLPEEFCINQCKKMIVFFMFGIFTNENKYLSKVITRTSTYQTFLTCLLFIIAEVYFLSYPSHHYNNEIIYKIISFILPYLGILFVIEISKLICRYKTIGNNNLILNISASSYIIYLFHTTFEGFTNAIVSKLSLNEGNIYTFSLEALIIILSGIMGPMILYKYVLKRWDITKFLFGLSK